MLNYPHLFHDQINDEIVRRKSLTALSCIQEKIVPNTSSTFSPVSPINMCHIPGKIFNVLSLLAADSYTNVAASGSHTTSSSPCKIINGTSSSWQCILIYLRTLKNSNSVAAGGFPELLRLGFLATNLLFYSSLNDLLATGFVTTTFQVGTNNAATGSSFSSGLVGLNFDEIPHIEPFKIKPSHPYF